MDIETSTNIFELAQNHKYAIFELAESGGGDSACVGFL